LRYVAVGAFSRTAKGAERGDSVFAALKLLPWDAVERH